MELLAQTPVRAAPYAPLGCHSALEDVWSVDWASTVNGVIFCQYLPHFHLCHGCSSSGFLCESHDRQNRLSASVTSSVFHHRLTSTSEGDVAYPSYLGGKAGYTLAESPFGLREFLAFLFKLGFCEFQTARHELLRNMSLMNSIYSKKKKKLSSTNFKTSKLEILNMRLNTKTTHHPHWSPKLFSRSLHIPCDLFPDYNVNTQRR